MTDSEDNKGSPEQEQLLQEARRTAFVARFIVLRESKRSRSHRVIEQMEWESSTTAEQLHDRFLGAFVDNGDNLEPVHRDLRRAMAHAARSIVHFIDEYTQRATLNFIDALFDYEKSNVLLFGDDEEPRQGGWRLPKELEYQKKKEE